MVAVPPPTPLSGLQPNNRCLKRNLKGQVPRPHLNTAAWQLPSPPARRRCPCSTSGTATGPYRSGGTESSGVETTGRITLRPHARRVLGSESSAQAVSGEGTLILHHGGVGVSLPIDRRGRLILPAWLRVAARLSGSVLVAARAVGLPAVVLTPTDILEDLVSHVAEAM